MRTYTNGRTKHPKDQNHGKRGWVSGNPRYSRAKADKVLSGKRTDGGRQHLTMRSN